MRRLSRLFVLPWLLQVAAPPRAVLSQSPDLTDEGRWNHAAQRVTLLVVDAIAQAHRSNRSAADVARAYARLHDAEFPHPLDPRGMLKAMKCEFLLWPGAIVTALNDTETCVRFQVNRPWLPQFGKKGEMCGVKPAELERCLEIFCCEIASARGLHYEQSLRAEQLVVTIRLAGKREFPKERKQPSTSLIQTPLRRCDSRAGNL